MSEDFDTARVPPQDLEAERAVLGAMLLEGEAAGLAIEKLVPADFVRSAHRIIFATLAEICLAGEKPDELLLRDALEKVQKLEECGGPDYPHELATSVPSAANLERYATLVKEKSIARMLINASTATLREAERAGDIQEAVDRGHARMTEVALRASGSSEGGAVRIGDLLQDNFKELEERHKNPQRVWGIETGLKSFDYRTGGLQPGELVIISARRSIGKTALLLSWFNHMISNGVGCLLFSLEMRNQSINNRLICMRSGVSFGALKSGYFGDQDWDSIVRANGELQDAPFWIDDTPSVSLAQIYAKARKGRAQDEVQVVAVDFLQIMSKPKGRSEAEEISTLSGGFKRLARELDIPLIVLSQNRKSDQNHVKAAPVMDDLKGSGAIGDNADVVVILHRKGNKDTGYENETQFNLAKQKNGEVGVRTVTYLPKQMRFVDYAPNEEEQASLG